METFKTHVLYVSGCSKGDIVAGCVVAIRRRLRSFEREGDEEMKKEEATERVS